MASHTLVPRQHEPDGAGLLALLKRQHELYQQLKQLSDDQMKLIAQGQTDALLNVLSQRQAVIETLGRVSDDLSPYRENWESLTHSLADEERQLARELVDKVDTMLAGILDQDDQARTHLQAAQQAIGQEIQQTTQAGSAINAYKVAGSASPRFADQQG